MILQESLCSELWCGGSQEPRHPPRGVLSHVHPGLGCVSTALGRSDDARLQKKQLHFGARSSSLGSPFRGDACCERPVGGARAQPRVRCWQRRSNWGLIRHPEPTPTRLPPPRLTTAAGDPQRSARQAPPDPRSPEVWGVSLGPGG